MISIKRFFIVCVAITLLVGSLLMQKIAEAADKGTKSRYAPQESSTVGAYSGGGGSTSKAGKNAADKSDATGNSSSSSEPTAEQMEKRQQIIVY
jgi:hypothetical protein